MNWINFYSFFFSTSSSSSFSLSSFFYILFKIYSKIYTYYNMTMTLLLLMAIIWLLYVCVLMNAYNTYLCIWIYIWYDIYHIIHVWNELTWIFVELEICLFVLSFCLALPDPTSPSLLIGRKFHYGFIWIHTHIY